jgi:hypothetical protein
VSNRRVFWMGSSGMLTAEVPTPAMSIDIGHRCPECSGGTVQSLDFTIGVVSCERRRHAFPHVFLLVNDDSLEVYRDGKIIETVPGSPPP